MVKIFEFLPSKLQYLEIGHILDDINIDTQLPKSIKHIKYTGSNPSLYERQNTTNNIKSNVTIIDDYLYNDWSNSEFEMEFRGFQSYFDKIWSP